MKNTVNKLMFIRLHNFRSIETKLENYAKKGLFLDSIGTFTWKFKKDEPKDMKYTVAFFSEGSIFNPSQTENQKVYIEMARESGWEFVAESNKLQVFSSGADNPIEFETDEEEKFKNIKKCINKSFLPSMVMLAIVFAFNVFMQLQVVKFDPIGLLISPYRLFPLITAVMLEIYYISLIAEYLLWCKKSEKSIRETGKCYEAKIDSVYIDIIALTLISTLTIGFLISFVASFNIPALLFTLLFVPFLFVIYLGTIKLLKKLNFSAKANMITSIAVLTLSCFAMIAVVFTSTILLLSEEKTSPEFSSTDLPITVQDIFSEHKDYEGFQYDIKAFDNILVSGAVYSQENYGLVNSPPLLTCTVYEAKFDFVENIIFNELYSLPNYPPHIAAFSNINSELIQSLNLDNIYQAFRSYEVPIGEYIIVKGNKIIYIDMTEPMNDAQLEKFISAIL